jgi:hypothetical protein
MFTGTYDSASGLLRIYVDGILKNTSISTGLQTYSTAGMYNYIGAVDGGTWQFFKGTMDELGVWNRALTPCEIAEMYMSITDPIVSHPVNDTGDAGTTASFSVTPALSSPLYQWQVRTGTSYTNLADVPPYSGVSTNTLTISPLTMALNGNVYRCLISSDSCTNVATDTAKLRVIPLVSVANNTQTVYRHVVYPNPGHGNFTLISTGTAGSIEIALIDITGRVLFSEIRENRNGENIHKFDVGDKLSSGTYIIRTSVNGEVQHIRYTYE